MSGVYRPWKQSQAFCTRAIMVQYLSKRVEHHEVIEIDEESLFFIEDHFTTGKEFEVKDATIILWEVFIEVMSNFWNSHVDSVNFCSSITPSTMELDRQYPEFRVLGNSCIIDKSLRVCILGLESRELQALSTNSRQNYNHSLSSCIL